MTVIACPTCRHIMDTDAGCTACAFRRDHHPDCKLRIAATCAVAIECDHGYDVCPTCDPCTCPRVEETAQ